MFDGLARVVARRPKTVLLITLLLVLVGGAFAADVQNRLKAGGFDDPASESSRVARVLDDTFGQGQPNLTLVIESSGAVDEPAAATAGAALTERLAAEPGVANVVSYWTAGQLPALRSDDGTKALLVARVLGDEDAQTAWVRDVLPRYRGEVDGFTIRAGGMAPAGDEISELSVRDAVKAEMFLFPVALVFLLLIFGSVRAAVIPLAIAFVVLLVAMACLWALGVSTDVSIFVMNMASILGLGLAIDYSLLLVSRYRDELRGGKDRVAALRTTLTTAGRTVTFSAITVAIVLSGITVLPFYSLSSLGWAGIITALLAAAASITVTPALLMVMGGRLERARWLGRRREERTGENGFWHRLATLVMRRPIPFALGAIALLLVLGAPFLNFKGGEVDERVLPADSQAYQVATEIRQDFQPGEQAALQVVATDVPPAAGRAADVAGYAQRLSEVTGVARVDAETGSYANGQPVAPPNPLSVRFTADEATYLAVVPSVDPQSDAAKQVARDVRDVASPFPVLVGGGAAVGLDALDSLYGALPWAVLIVAVAMLVLLFLLTGSVVLPVSAVVLSGLSLTATFGALVWVFQEGRLKWLVGDFNDTGATIWVVPVMLFAFAFGLAMDYQVFMLSRIHEEYLRTGDNTTAVALGLERIGRVVTAAALLIAVVFLGLVASGVTHVKAVGLGVALAVLVDATVVRGALLPAFMRLTGRWSWWAPGPLARLHARVGLREHGTEAPAGTGPPERVPARR